MQPHQHSSSKKFGKNKNKQASKDQNSKILVTKIRKEIQRSKQSFLTFKLMTIMPDNCKSAAGRLGFYKKFALDTLAEILLKITYESLWVLI